MKVIRTKSHRRKGPRPNGFFKHNQKLILLTIIFIIGVSFGALAVKTLNENEGQGLHGLIRNCYTAQSHQSFLENFLSALGSETLILLVCFIFGLCVIGEPAMWLIPGLRGLGTGLVVGFLYKNFALTGLFYFAAVLLLPTVLASAVTVIGCQESILTTRDLNRVLRAGERGEDLLRSYLIRYAVLFAAALLISLFGAALSSLFAAKFNLLSQVLFSA